MSIPAIKVSARRRPETLMPSGLDPRVFTQNALRELRLTGWVMHPEFPVTELVLGRGAETLVKTTTGQHRPKAYEAHRDLPGAHAPGYTLTLANPQAGSYWLAVVDPQGDTQAFADLELVPETRPQLFYMHIAKAGGSTLNRYFQRQCDPAISRSNIESAAEWLETPWALADYEFLSGHISLRALDIRLDARRFRLLTVMREPWSQLVSHLAWVRRLADPGEEQRLAEHSAPVQAFARKLAACDFTSPAEVATLMGSLVHDERILMDNCQVRYFARVAGDWVSKSDCSEAVEALGRFRHIGFTSDLDGFMARVAADMGWKKPEPAGHVNVTGNFYGLDKAGKELRQQLHPLIRWDEQLYAAAQGR